MAGGALAGRCRLVTSMPQDLEGDLVVEELFPAFHCQLAEGRS